MWKGLAFFLFISVCGAAVLPNLLTLEEDLELATYLAKKTSYDVDVLTARTKILKLELQYTALDLFVKIQILLRQLLFPTDAERVIADMNKTADSVLSNVVRLEEAVARLDTSLALLENDLASGNTAALNGDQLLLESYIFNFNLTYDIGKENIVLATNNLVLTLTKELEGIDDPLVNTVSNLAEKIRVVLLTEQEYLDNARLSFDRNEVALLDALSKVVGQLPSKVATTENTTTWSVIPTTPLTSTTPAAA
ncbi:uncharacterized protein LOC132195952 [Neocloeon triangulifer]|uniref:uncharacterized protein LOC132195952 n=1 Tax=Neocloeon triangulifer TaxID=2078957 RepID=UPI00286F1AB2|nr:uncharacterized protein LOC132195952 [Neocloeon triangulifer]